MAYRIAGIDVHKRKLAVVVADVEVEDEYQFERRWYGSNPEQLRVLSEWLLEQQIEEVVMESTAQYWKPVWGALERYWKPRCQSREGAGRMSGTLHLAQALSNRGRRGRKKDFRDAERLVKRLVSQELVLSFVPDSEQRMWRTLTRTRYQRTRDKVRLQNQLEALLEEAHIKLSSLVSDLLGASAAPCRHLARHATVPVWRVSADPSPGPVDRSAARRIASPPASSSPAARGRRNRSRGCGRLGRSALTRHTGTVA
jgi:transposase